MRTTSTQFEARRTRAFVAATAFVCVAAAGCSSGPPEFAGVWASSDGTPDKVISADGRCTGMYYTNGQPLDIGGPMSCTFGQEQADGSFPLVVQQPPNQTTYTVTFRDEDTMEMQQNGQPVVVLTRR